MVFSEADVGGKAEELTRLCVAAETELISAELIKQQATMGSHKVDLEI
jgi:hypothetical protein